MPTLKAKILTAAAVLALIAGQLAIIAAMNARIGRLKIELQSAHTATQSAQTAHALEAARFQSYRIAAETLSEQMQAAQAGAGQSRARLADTLKQHPDWANVELPPEIAATLNQGPQK